MQSIIDFLNQIVDAINAVIDFVVKFVQDIIYVVGLIGDFIVDIPNFFGWLPASLLSILVLVFSVVAIYKILGRS